MILLGICSGGTVQVNTVYSLIALLSTTRLPLTFSVRIGGYKPHSLNELVQEAQETGATHLLNIDTDMVFPPDVVDKLFAAKKDIVGVNYHQRGNHLDQEGPPSTIKFPGNEKNGYRTVLEKDFPKELFECAAVGLGITLIDLKVFDKLPKPYFKTKESKSGEHRTEDIVFCQDARKAGFEVWCDPTIEVKHIGQYLY